ncbi:MAG: HAMP domain-containing histidine kinase [Pirellulaceae bacterium]|nr:HAMP domain-containing histidine kinase [Pirellulaceae bacterium]
MSLSRKLTVPILLAALVTTIAVTLASYWLAVSSTEAELHDRYAAIELMIQRSNFPLNPTVLSMLGSLTSATWFTTSSDGVVLAGRPIRAKPDVPIEPAEQPDRELLTSIPRYADSGLIASIRLGEHWYRAARFQRSSGSDLREHNAVQEVVVIVDDSSRRAAIRRAISAPLIVGLLTIACMVAISLMVTSRWARRVGRLQADVNLIARGNFLTPVSIDSQDELGDLARDVAGMAQQLDQMWKKFRRWHSEQLLHQISSGLAHNLRNALTGARMAVELAQATTSGASDKRGEVASLPEELDPLSVAVAQVEQAEQYVSRILLACRNDTHRPQPMVLAECFQTLQTTLSATAAHRGANIQWHLPEQLANFIVNDGLTLMAAIGNLIWNAIAAGKQISVSGDVHSSSRCAVVSVTDDGPGPDPAIWDTLFDPFVTTKVDGLGLGLALVQRAAESLGGRVTWIRRDQRTVFELTFHVEKAATAPCP